MLSTKRRRTVALILSGVFPGLGQFYNRRPIKGAVFLGLSVLLSWLVMRAVPVDPARLAEQGIGLPASLAVLILLAIWLWSVVDAWRDADIR